MELRRGFSMDYFIVMAINLPLTEENQMLNLNLNLKSEQPETKQKIKDSNEHQNKEEQINTDGTKEWFQHGKLHRDGDKPDLVK